MARRRRRSESSESGGVAHWMLTYSDMVTLLLCFFVLLFAFSTIDIQKFRAIMSAFQGSIGVLDSGRALHQDDRVEDAALEMDLEQVIMQPSMQEIRQLQDIFDTLQNWAAQQDLEGLVYMVMEERGIVIRFADRVLFELGKANLTEEAKVVLSRIGGLLARLPNHVRVEGHTDNLPIRTAMFPSNWELSTARATSVIRYLIENCGLKPSMLSAAGYGEYRPIQSNNTDEGRAANRRVDIVILRQGLSEAEPYSPPLDKSDVKERDVNGEWT
ncbi:MAG: OmpA family protein [Firmicutes bacterium]|nr:OmpA family protein [Bacillota bacterium]